MPLYIGGKQINKVTTEITANDLPTLINDALETHILEGKEAIDRMGEKIIGTMPDHGNINETLTSLDGESEYYITPGYYTGGTIKVIPEESLSFTPDKEGGIVKATDGKVLSTVEIKPIPEQYVDISDANLEDSQHLFSGLIAYGPNGKVEGAFTLENEINTQAELLTHINDQLNNISLSPALPELSNPASANEVIEGYDYIDGFGERVEGKFTIVDELNDQQELLNEITEVIKTKANEYELGKQAAYDAFWDVYQNKGSQSNYYHAFGDYWAEETFRPKYDLIPRYAQHMFTNFSAKLELDKHLVNCGVKLDFSQCDAMTYVFSSSKILSVGEIKVKENIDISGIFSNAKELQKIDNLNLGGNNKLNQAFLNCNNLLEINFSGIIDHADGINLGDSHYLDFNSAENIPSKQGPSIRSLFNTLTDDRTQSRSITLSGQAIGKAFETGVDAMDGLDSDAFLELVNSRPSWRIVLA